MIRPLYKSVEPFMEVKRGYGYQGVVQYDDVEDKIQCHICGQWFKCLPRHINKHKISIADYRDEYGLPIRGGLVSVGVAKRMSEVASRPENIARCRKSIKAWGTQPLSRKRAALRLSVRRATTARNRMAFKNGKALCDLQIKARYDVVRRIVGHSPSIPELQKYDCALLGKLRHIGFNEWKKKNGLKVLTRGNPFGDLSLIAHLRRWGQSHKKNRTKYHYDCTSKGPRSITYMRNYGSWQNALSQAGLK